MQSLIDLVMVGSMFGFDRLAIQVGVIHELPFILDTDAASLFLAGNQKLIYRVTQAVPHVVTTIVTVQELFNGWAGRVNDPAEANNLVRIYGKLWQTTEFLKTIEILTLDRVLVRSICFHSIGWR
jgi:hypothetical protein